jgi:aspartokinase/homoserine dehydrogenase 1
MNVPLLQISKEKCFFAIFFWRFLTNSLLLQLSFASASFVSRGALHYLNIQDMKVLKFGGTSVGSVKSILSLKRIVENEAKRQSVVVVVSALGGITDKLIATSQLALKHDPKWKEEFDAMVERHHSMIDHIIDDTTQQEDLFNKVDALFDQLKSIYHGVFLVHDLSEKTLCAIVSYGERLSSNIVATLIRGAKWFDSRDFIKTERKNGKNVLDSDLTNKLVADTFENLPRVSLVPGFISRDRDTDEITNLGRGGSDYTAAIIAAALDAEVLEIWTDVNGFMTADPRVISSAYTINELSYVEAMELCNFGAKVIYPPTIYPVCIKNIPIKVKNTFNPENPGTIIKQKIEDDRKPIKGISSIKGTALINVTGLSMVGVIGVNRRIFTRLADNGISVFMVSQASSENSTSIGVREEDVNEAVRVLNEEFAAEIEDGAMFPMQVELGLATVAIVGENMKHTPGIAGKLFGTLGRSGISVIACAQGASETNISFVVKADSLRKSLNVIHDSFFLSEYNVLNLFICGVGTVGGQLIEQIKCQYEELKHRSQLKLNVVGIASSHNAIFNREGIDLDNYRALLKESEPSNPQKLRDNILSMNIFNSVFVDCTASKDIAALYESLLAHNISVIAANKIAASGDYDYYQKLKHLALAKGVKFRYETNVGAGLPIIGTINDLRNSGDKILKIEAVLSGTLNFIFNEIAADVPFSETVKRAKQQGYSEPDPRIDLSGTDVVRKLVILSREAGYKVSQEDVEKKLFVPQNFFEGSVDDFWEHLPSLDNEFEQQRKQLEAEGKRWRFVATYDNGHTEVALRAVGQNSPFYNLEGSNNIVLLTTERYKQYPMLIQGYGAGADVTAAGVFANIMSIANI